MAQIDLKGHSDMNGRIGSTLTFPDDAFGTDATAIVYNGDAIVSAYRALAAQLSIIRDQMINIDKQFDKARKYGSSKGKKLEKTSNYNTPNATLQDQVILLSNRLGKRVSTIQTRIDQLTTEANTISVVLDMQQKNQNDAVRAMNANMSKDDVDRIS